MNIELAKYVNNMLNNEENITFEKAIIKDIDEIINLYAERIRWFKEKEIKQWSKYLSNHPKEQFIQAIEKGNYYILKKDNEIIAGFEISKYSNFWNDTKSNSYYLYKQFQKQDIKILVIKYLKQQKNITKADGKDCLRIDCLTSNKKLNELYAKHGFEYVKEGKSYYNYTLREWKVNK